MSRRRRAAPRRLKGAMRDLDAGRLAAAEALDRAYAEAEAFDAARMIECWADEAEWLAAAEAHAEAIDEDRERRERRP